MVRVVAVKKDRYRQKLIRLDLIAFRNRFFMNYFIDYKLIIVLQN